MTFMGAEATLLIKIIKQIPPTQLFYCDPSQHGILNQEKLRGPQGFCEENSYQMARSTIKSILP